MSREKRVRKARAAKNSVRRRARLRELALIAARSMRERFPEWYGHIKETPQ